MFKSLKAVQNTIANTIDNIKEDGNSTIDKYWPLVEDLLIKKLLSLTQDSLNDDKALEKFFSTIYETIPTPVRIILPREAFIQFCLTQKEPLLNKVQSIKQEIENNSINQNVTFNETPTLYEELLPELLALCIVADGHVESSEIKLATEVIMNDNILKDKEKALNNLSTHIGTLILEKNNSLTTFKLKSMDIFTKISKIEDINEKERINIIVDGMLEVVANDSLEETKTITDNIKNKLK